MNISFPQTEQQKDTGRIYADRNAYAGKEEQVKSASHAGGVHWDASASPVSSQAYRDDKERGESLLDAADQYDAENSKDFMVVMSNTLSDEDYRKIQENGGNPGDYEPGEIVTVVDEIKVTLAEAGVYIGGYTDNIDDAALERITGNKAYAEAVKEALQAKGLPATKKNVTECLSEVEKAEQISSLSDGAKKYLLENHMEPSIDALYKASYAAGGVKTEQASGYFAAGTQGYYAKKGAVEDLLALEDQIKKTVERAGLEVSGENLDRARWLLQNGLPLTEENLQALSELEEIQFPIDAGRAALAAADAIAAGLPAESASLPVGDNYENKQAGYIEKAGTINKKTQELKEESVDIALRRGGRLTLSLLFAIGSESASAKGSAGEKEGTDGNPAFSEEAAAAKKQLLEIQLLMSTQANLKLMKRGIRIETEPLEKLLTQLSGQEKAYHATELAGVQQKREEIKAMPAAVVGEAVREAWLTKGIFTLNRFHEIGKVSAHAYERAGQTYEALMTAPRADLGDSIKTAFRNVDALLEENGFAVTSDNRRAVRILGYNGMEISEENLSEVKAADAMLQRVIKRLTPEKTLRMIREGVNPLEMKLDELSEYLSDTPDESAKMEKYSRFLYRLEQNNQIEEQEREAYIGIYRLLRQVEKGDYAAVGSVVASGRELNLGSLLGAVRTQKKGYVDQKIDDAFGLLTEVEQKGTSVLAQIQSYYSLRAGEMADALGGEESSADGGGDPFLQEEIAQCRESGMVSEAHFEALIRDHIPVNAEHLAAQQQLTEKGGVFSRLLRQAGSRDKEERLEKKYRQIAERMSGGSEELQEAYEELGREAAEVLQESAKESGSYIDVRSMAMTMRQIELVEKHAKEESYYVPVALSEGWQLLHVQINQEGGPGRVSVDYAGESEEDRILAVFVTKGGRIEGLVGIGDKEKADRFTAIASNCAEKILRKTGKEADITCVHSQTMKTDAFVGTQEAQNEISTRELYEVAKAFIQTMEQEVTAS